MQVPELVKLGASCSIDVPGVVMVELVDGVMGRGVVYLMLCESGFHDRLQLYGHHDLLDTKSEEDTNRFRDSVSLFHIGGAALRDCGTVHTIRSKGNSSTTKLAEVSFCLDSLNAI
jgi:hypothetical protein